ncbi:MAG TPA: hypothetical protein VM864_01450 [Pyrinomonadaceae bacterium]|jgi:hypothetical protein|nr:hypothetical protein [Pyrinomonadaceae bacterium]
MSERTTPRLVKLLVPALLCALAPSATAGAQTSRSHARATTRQATRPRTTSRNAPPAQTTAQPPAPATVQTPAAPPSVPEEDADLVIIANVTAKELEFETAPNPKVEFPGQPRRETEWSAERTNLPPQVQPGVTYRDIGIRLKIVSRFADIDRIVAEALGEIPTSDDAPQPAAPPPPATDTQPAAERSTQPTAARRDDIRPGATRANVTRQPAASRKARARGAGRSR